LINGNFNGSEEEKQTIATNLMTLLQLPPEKLIQLTSSMEKNLLNGELIKKLLFLGFFFLSTQCCLLAMFPLSISKFSSSNSDSIVFGKSIRILGQKEKKIETELPII